MRQLYCNNNLVFLFTVNVKSQVKDNIVISATIFYKAEFIVWKNIPKPKLIYKTKQKKNESHLKSNETTLS